MHACDAFSASLCRPCWVLIDDTSKKAYFEDWQLLKDGQNFYFVEDSTQTVPCAADSTKLRRTEKSYCALKREQLWDTSSPKSSWQAVGEPDAPTWKLLLRPLGKIGGTIASPKKRVQLYSPKAAQSSPERQKLPYLDEEILSGYEAYEMVLLRG